MVGARHWRPRRGPATGPAEYLRPVLGFEQSRHQPKLRNHFAPGPDLGHAGFPLGYGGVPDAGWGTDHRAIEPKNALGASDYGLLRAGGRRESCGGSLRRLRHASRRDESGRGPIPWPARGPVFDFPGCAQDVSARGCGWRAHDLRHWREKVSLGHVHQLSNRQGLHSPRDDARGIQQGGLEEAMKSSVLEVDPKRYGRLFARKLPAVIRTEEENERLIAELEQFDKRYDELTPEEREYSELLTVLIEAFEDANSALAGSTSDSRLRRLMQAHGLRQRDLLDVFGSRGIASEVVSGKRAISKAQAKKLAELFHVPADLFL